MKNLTLIILYFLFLGSLTAQEINSIPLLGDKGENVRVIQKELTKKGFSLGTIDGDFGNKTSNALKQFQSKQALEAHGFVDLPTLSALNIGYIPKVNDNGFVALSWENKDASRKSWSDYTFKLIDSLFSSFDNCKDILRIRPDYNSLSHQQKVNVWGEVISAIALPESGWKPTSAMVEKTQGKDIITKDSVRSEGLLQLSYQDKIYYPKLPCRFDWEKDKNLSKTDPKKTIFDPYINLEMGINILAQQIRNQGKVILSKNVYWAVIKENGKYEKITQITTMVRNIKF